MNDNPYFSARPKPCPKSLSDLSMLMLKAWLLTAVSRGRCVSYRGRIFMFTNAYEVGEQTVLRILRPAIPDVSVDLRVENPAKAVDFFVDSFLYENGLDLGEVAAHVSEDMTSAATPWSSASRKLKVSTLMSAHNNNPANAD